MTIAVPLAQLSREGRLLGALVGGKGRHINWQCKGETLEERSRVILRSDIQNGVSRISVDCGSQDC